MGRALAFVNDRGWGRWTGSRRIVPKTLIVITDGDSKDEFQSMAASLRDKGVNIISIGIDRARQDLLMDRVDENYTHAFSYITLLSFLIIIKEHLGRI